MPYHILGLSVKIVPASAQLHAVSQHPRIHLLAVLCPEWSRSVGSPTLLKSILARSTREMALRELLIKTDSRCAYQMLWWGVPVGTHGQYESICHSQKNGTPVHVLCAAHPLKEADHNAPCCPLLLPIGQPITHLEAVKQSAMVSLHRDQGGEALVKWQWGEIR